MKKQFVLFISILLCSSLLSVAKGQGKTPVMTRKFTAASIKEVESSTSGGSLTLIGDAGSEAVVELYVSGKNWSNEKIKKELDENYIIDIKVERGKLYATAKLKNRFTGWISPGLSISFKISVPKQVNSKLQTSGGSIQISNLSGSQNFTTSGGSLSIENVSGNISGATSGGSITIVGSKDNIELRTSGGSITAKDCSGKIELKTSGGSLNLSNLRGNIKASTSGGSVSANEIDGTLITGTSGGSVRINGFSGDIDAHTSGGSMDVKILSVSNYVKLSNSGKINLYLPAGKGYNMKVKGSNKISTSGLKDFRGNMDTRTLDGTIGKGGPEINVKSSQQINLLFE